MSMDAGSKLVPLAEGPPPPRRLSRLEAIVLWLDALVTLLALAGVLWLAYLLHWVALHPPGPYDTATREFPIYAELCIMVYLAPSAVLSAAAGASLWRRRRGRWAWQLPASCWSLGPLMLWVIVVQLVPRL